MPHTIFENVSAQMWRVQPGGGGRRFDQKYPPNALTSQQSSESIDAVGGYVDAAGILYFCKPDIYAILITDQLSLEEDKASNTLILRAFKSGKHIPLCVYVTKGSGESLAGFTINYRDDQSTIKTKEHYCIRVLIRSNRDRNPFLQEFENCRKRWQEESTRLRNLREARRHPLIRPKSHFSFG